MLVVIKCTCIANRPAYWQIFRPFPVSSFISSLIYTNLIYGRRSPHQPLKFIHSILLTTLPSPSLMNGTRSNAQKAGQEEDGAHVSAHNQQRYVPPPSRSQSTNDHKVRAPRPPCFIRTRVPPTVAVTTTFYATLFCQLDAWWAHHTTHTVSSF